MEGSTIYVSEALVGEPVGLTETEDGGWRVHYGPIALGIIAHGSGHLRKPKRRTRGHVENPSGFPTYPPAQQQ